MKVGQSTARRTQPYFRFGFVRRSRSSPRVALANFAGSVTTAVIFNCDRRLFEIPLDQADTRRHCGDDASRFEKRRDFSAMISQEVDLRGQSFTALFVGIKEPTCPAILNHSSTRSRCV